MTTKQEQIDQLLASLPDDARPPFKLRLFWRTVIYQGEARLIEKGPQQGLYVPEWGRFEEGTMILQVRQYPELADANKALVDRVACALAYQAWQEEVAEMQALAEKLSRLSASGEAGGE